MDKNDLKAITRERIFFLRILIFHSWLQVFYGFFIQMFNSFKWMVIIRKKCLMYSPTNKTGSFTSFSVVQLLKD